MQPEHVFPRHREQAEGEVVAQLRFDREGKAHDVGEASEIVGLDAGRIELAPKRRNLGVGTRDGLLEASKLQRLELVARHGLGRAIEHVTLIAPHRPRPYPDCAARRAAFALSRSNVLALSMTKRVWVPAPTSSSSSFTFTSKDTLRPSTAAPCTQISTVIPLTLGATSLIP